MVKIVNPDGCNTGLRNAVYTDVYSNQASASLVSVGGIGKTGFSIYPVPANDQINIQFGNNAKGNINLTITDVAGRIIYSAGYSDVSQGRCIPLTALPLLKDCICCMRFHQATGLPGNLLFNINP
ncbi:MAG: hypothetical protein IPH20_01570 [Bacteroidales bacterium]|nr:hypothetical protein [Bacteroidales bacterium]